MKLKNLLLYLNPKGFDENTEKMVKLQIENMLELGWKPEDIILITNFSYEFMGVEATLVSDDCFFSADPASTKSYALARLIDSDLFNDEDIYWLHDIDHFQQLPITKEEIIKEMGECDFALCDYGRRIKLNCGSIFFKKSAGDIFKKIRDIIVKYRPLYPKCEEERALMILTTNNLKWAFRSSVGAENSFEDAGITEEVNKRIHRMPITYNFADYNFGSTWQMCEGKPKTAHFNPFYEKKTKSNPTGCKLPFFLGNNRLNLVLLNKRLIRLFKKYIMETPQSIKDLQALEFNRHRRVWEPFLRKYDIKNICEVGVFESQNLKRFLYGEPQVLVGIDLWKEVGVPSINDSGFDQERLDDQFNYCKSLMFKYPCIRLYRQYSDEAAENFPDEYFDLIYIDADHSYEGVTKDLQAYWPKVKKGRFFTGDDYSHSHAPVTGVKFGVVEAVDDFAKANNLTVYELPSHGWAIIKL